MAANATTNGPQGAAPPAHQPQSDFFRRFVRLSGAYWQ